MIAGELVVDAGRAGHTLRGGGPTTRAGGLAGGIRHGLAARGALGGHAILEDRDIALLCGRPILRTRALPYRRRLLPTDRRQHDGRYHHESGEREPDPLGHPRRGSRWVLPQNILDRAGEALHVVGPAGVAELDG